MINTQINRLRELADHAQRNGHDVRIKESRDSVIFEYGAISRKILTHEHTHASAMRRIDECCEILESIAFKPAPSAQTK